VNASEFEQRARAARLTDAEIELCATFTCADHNDTPLDGPGFDAWAEQMTKTHRQLICGECLRWRIWVPK
jgi:hypothetical protein